MIYSEFYRSDLIKKQNRITNPEMIDCAMIEKELESDIHISIRFYDNNYNDKMLSELR